MGDVARVLVIGGGIGGLGAATAMAQRGIEVVLAEIKPEFTVYGVGLGQPANALRVLDAIGVLQECLDAGFQFDRLRFCDFNRELIAEHKFLLGGPSLPAVNALPRADLHRILTGAAARAGVEVRLGTTAADFEQAPDSVQVTFIDGHSESFDLVVGFDGIRSATRRALFGEAYEPVFSGYSAWRTIVERPADVTCMEFYQGLGSKTGVMPLNEKEMYLFHIRPEPGNPWMDENRLPELLRERLSGFGGMVADVCAALSDSSEVFYSPLEPMLAPPPWFSGRVVIAGDSAHVYPPHLTQGAAMALEDGLVLADELVQDKPMSKRLSDFMTRRYARCAFVHSFSNQMLFAEQSIQTAAHLEAASRELAANASVRLAAADRFLNQPVVQSDKEWAA